MTQQGAMLSAGSQRKFAGLAVFGFAAFAVGLATDAPRAWVSYLASAYYFLTLSLGGLGVLALLHLTAAGWSSVIKRVPEAMAGYLPVGAASMFGLLFGMHSLYHWASVHDDPVLALKQPYLNTTFFVVRMVVFLGLWLAFAVALRRASVAQDKDGDVAHTRRSVALSAGFVFCFAYTFSLGSVDWVMSREPHWQSTIFGFYNVAGLLLGAFASCTVAVILLRRAGALPQVNENHLHDLGKLTFGFCTFWAYIWVSQFLLIWYANLPEETAYYITRTHGGWSYLFYANVAINWVIPFFALLPRAAKRSETRLLRACGVVLVGRWLDIYLMVAPGSSPEHATLGWLEIAMFAGFAGVFILVVSRTLRAAPMVAANDPYLVEGIHHHQ